MTFRILINLPAADDALRGAVSPSPPAAPQTALPPARMQVLVVEDEVALARELHKPFPPNRALELVAEASCRRTPSVR